MYVLRQKLLPNERHLLINSLHTSSEITFKPCRLSVYHLFSSQNVIMCLLWLLKQTAILSYPALSAQSYLW